MTGVPFERGPGNRRGLTLIEILLALLITAVLALLTARTLATGLELSRRAYNLREGLHDRRWVLRLLADDLENTLPYRQDGRAVFSGMGDHVTLIRSSDEGLKEVHYALHEPEETVVHEVRVGETRNADDPLVFQSEDNERLLELVREERSFPYDPNVEPADNEITREVISDSVAPGALQLAYAVFPAQSGDALNWQGTWQGESLPQAVRISFVVSGGAAVRRNILIPAGEGSASP